MGSFPEVGLDRLDKIMGTLMLKTMGGFLQSRCFDDRLKQLPNRAWRSIKEMLNVKMLFLPYPIRACLILFIGTLALFPGYVAAIDDDPVGTGVAKRLKIRIMAQDNGNGFVCRGEPICGIQILPLYYAANDFKPVWSDATGLRSSVRYLLQAVEDAENDGLRPEDYHLTAIRKVIAQIENPPPLTNDQLLDGWADLDLLLTDAFLLLGAHLSAGRVNPETLHSDWVLSERSVDLAAALDKVAHESEKTKAMAAIQALRPQHSAYRYLRQAYGRLRRMAGTGGWPEIPQGETLRPGDTHPRLISLRQRLTISGDLENAGNHDAIYYDEALKSAVMTFQKRHGLAPDGLVGRNTLAALNVPMDARIRQMKLNLERWRWLPNDLGERYILVNTADFHLMAVENLTGVMDMRVVVGRPARRSPVFSSRITYLVLNPYWNVPTSIVVRDILPRLQNGQDYLSQQRFKVFNGWSNNAEEIAPDSIDWSIYSRNYFPFRLRQEPGPANALGRIKFMFPNKFAVYLHDTPHRSHFDRAQRDFSSGCIRVEDAVGLAEYLLDDPQWSSSSIRQALTTAHNQVVRLIRPMVIHLLYMTAWATPDGQLHFRKDIYERDDALDKALRHRMPLKPTFRPFVRHDPEHSGPVQPEMHQDPSPVLNDD